MTAVAVMRHESELGTWTHAEWVPKPNSPLAGLIDLTAHFPGGTSLAAGADQNLQDTASSIAVDSSV